MSSNSGRKIEDEDEFTDFTETCQVCGGKPVSPYSGMCFRCHNNL